MKHVPMLVAMAAAVGAAAASSGEQRTPSLPAGTFNLYTVTVGAWELASVSGGDQTRWVDLAGGEHLRACLSGPCSLEGTLHLPSGALLDHIELDACDTDVEDVVAALYDCLDDSHGPGPCETLDTVDTEGVSGCAYVSGSQISRSIANLDHDYVLAVDLHTLQTALRGIKIYYTLQVSPGPATPTFNDVPVSDPAFPFIEAFTAAGITAGCSSSPPRYCPDATVTRRQMAVFFAKALGLNFPY